MAFKKYKSSEEIHAENKYISNQCGIFSDRAKGELSKELADLLSDNFPQTQEWLNSITPEKWDNLFKDLKIIENEHRQNLENIRVLSCTDIVVDYSETLSAIARIQNALNHIGFMLMAAGALSKHAKRITAKQNRAKRQDKVNPNIEKARTIARDIWAVRSSTALLDVAYEIKNKLQIRTSSTTIQEWIRDLNPNAKSKKTK